MALRSSGPAESLAIASEAFELISRIDNPAYTAYIAYPLADALIDHHRGEEAAELLHRALDSAETANLDFIRSLGLQRVAIHAESLRTDVPELTRRR